MTTLNRIDVITAFVGEEVNVVKTENNFSNFQKVAGEITRLKGLPKNIKLLPANEGKEKNLKSNLLLMKNGRVSAVINGDAYFVSMDKAGDVISLNENEIEVVHDWLIDAKHVKVI